MYSKCVHYVEIGVHVVRDCPQASLVWSRLGYQWSNHVSDTNCLEWFGWVLDNNSKSKHAEIITTVWALWLARNKAYHSGKQMSDMDLLHIRQLHGNLRQPPWRVDHITSVFMAEAVAVVYTAQFTVEMGFRKVVVEGDSRTITEKLRSQYPDLSEVNDITWKVRNRTKFFLECRFSFVPREGNKATHYLAADQGTNDRDYFWVEKAPTYSTEVLRALSDFPCTERFNFSNLFSQQ
ncbi:uncharacterized protein LOC120124423 [Hibiscus syriacus]|uniref:uncharacterized protein LOC120124423 n=1 Tax=Hibiscus syriacus TaxID=106335 RepID=UPI001924B23A|nr:uncharacterized protein LOC120124423 [Hibiscus syriacus]